MAQYSWAQLPQWVAKVERIQTAVVKQATNDLLAGIEIAPGITRGGGRQKGTVPRDLGTLAASLQSTLMGSSALSAGGQDSYALVAGAMEAGDVAQFTWGGGAAPYAAAVHFGANGLPGTFWVDVAAGKWRGYVAAAVRRARAEITR